jgi:hypothetical protein
LVTAVLLVLGASPLAHAGGAALGYDLTGTWTGAIKCKSFDTGGKVKFTLTPLALLISQNGLAIGMLADYGGLSDRYVAVANPDVKKPLEKGELALVVCGTNDQVGDDSDFDEIGRLTVKAKPAVVKAKLAGTSIFSDPGVLAPEAGTCKWKFTRTGTTDPGVPTSCGMVMTTLPPGQ